MKTLIKKTWVKILLIIIMLALLVTVTVIVTKKDTPVKKQTDDAMINKAIPPMNAKTLFDEKNITNADLPQEPYLVNIWASWCFSCSQEHELLLQLQQQGTKIVGITYKDDATKAKEYLEREGSPYLFNIQDSEGLIGRSLAVKGTPTTYTVDSQGVIRQQITGLITDSVWQERIKPCLSALKNNSQKQAKACQ